MAIARPGATDTPPRSTAWMTADPGRLAEIAVLRGFMPAVTSELLLVTRQGVPIASDAVRDVTSLARLLDHASALLWDLNLENRRTLLDRSHYRRAVRAAQASGNDAASEVLANPLRVELLQRLGVARLDARIELDAEGHVTDLTLQPTSVFPAGSADMLRAAIRRSDVFLPVLQDGKPVAGTLDYSFVVPPPPDPQLAAETAWVAGGARSRVPIPGWLVLRPIRGVDRVFTTVDGVRSDGTVVLHSVKAGTARLDSFREDWFDRTGGAASVQSVQGLEQEVGGEKFLWQRVSPARDVVDLARGVGDSDYCVGYAWTEVESPAETEAWLGIGTTMATRSG